MVSVVLLASSTISHAAINVSPANKIFGSAIKNGPLPAGVELTTFEHNCTTPPCVVTQLHVPSIYPGNGCPFDWENGIFRAYVDGEATPSVEVTLLELASVGHLAAQDASAPQDGSPFGHDLFGKNAKTGGVYSTMRIPFASTLRTTMQGYSDCGKQMIMWQIIRGVEGMPVQLGDLVLPDQARLEVQRVRNVTLQPRDFVTIASAGAERAGALANVFFDTTSADPNFLEACVRLYKDGDSTPLFLSSGTEDFFNSASYFDEGRFTNSQSGLTYADGHDFSMYKTLAGRDLVLWSAGMNLTWRNQEESSGPLACPTAWGAPADSSAVDSAVAAVRARNAARSARRGGALRTGPDNVNALVWLYTWPAATELLTFRGRPAAQPPAVTAAHVLRSLVASGALPAASEAAAMDLLLDARRGDAVAALLSEYAAEPAKAAAALLRALLAK